MLVCETLSTLKYMTSLSDEALLAEYLAASNEELLNELFARYHSRVAAWCLRITGDREHAADLAQEVFIKVHRNLGSFRGHAKFGTWLYSVVRNHCYNALRSRSAEPEFLGSEALEPLAGSPDLDAHSQLEKKTNSEYLQQLMRTSLDDVEMRVMVLHYVEELPLDSVTRLLRLTNSSGAKAFVVSARRKLQAAIKGRKGRMLDGRR